MRHLAVVLLLTAGCSSSPAHPPHALDAATPPVDSLGPLGRWGEDPTLTPPFALTQERRAPKLPDVRKEIAARSERHLGALDDGLLLCHVEIDRKVGWDTFAGPDARVRFQAGPRHAVELWGPEDHWSFEVSIPRVTMREGDPLLWALWDRDVGSDTEVGASSVVWDGAAPIAWSAPHADTSCQIATHEEAEAIARPMLDDIDGTLSGMEGSQPDPLEEGLGNFDGRDEDLQGMFKRSWRNWHKHYPLRYAAGALGWDSPEIQARLERLAAAEHAWRGACRTLVERERATAAPRGTWVRVGDTRCPKPTRGYSTHCDEDPGIELRVTGVTCGGRPIDDRGDDRGDGRGDGRDVKEGACGIAIEQRVAQGGTLCLPYFLSTLRADGTASETVLANADAAGKPAACNAPAPNPAVSSSLVVMQASGMPAMNGTPGKPGESRWRTEEHPPSPPSLLQILWNDPSQPARRSAWLRLDR